MKKPKTSATKRKSAAASNGTVQPLSVAKGSHPVPETGGALSVAPGSHPVPGPGVESEPEA